MTISVCGTMKTMVLVQAHVVSERSLSPVWILQQKLAAWLFTHQHGHFKVVAHNMEGYDGYFLLEYLIDHSIRPQKIIYNGSKIMYMTVERG